MTPINRVNRWIPLVSLAILLLTFVAAGLGQRGDRSSDSKSSKKTSSKATSSKNSSRSGSVKHSSSGTSGRSTSSSANRDTRSDSRDDRSDSRKEVNENRSERREERYENSRRGRAWERREERYKQQRRRAVVGTLLRTLPQGTQTQTVNQTTYYVSSGTYYTKTYSGGEVVYIVVTQP